MILLKLSNALTTPRWVSVPQSGSYLVKCTEVAEQIEAGSVWINSGPRPAAQGHFGGVKESGVGTEFGTNSILAYANIKAIHTYKA